MPQLKVWDGTSWVEIVGAQGAQGEPGPPGEQGSPGVAATVNIGTTTTGAAGSNASVTNTGTSQAAVLSFTVPRGAQGIQGIQGVKGDTGSAGTNATITGATATGLAAGANPTVTVGGTASARTFQFGLPKGDKGDKGDTGNTGAVGPSPFHVGTSAPSDPSVKSVWFDPTAG